MSLCTIVNNKDLLGEVISYLDPWSVGNLYASSKDSRYIYPILKDVELDYAILTGVSSFAARAKRVNSECVHDFMTTNEQLYFAELNGYRICKYSTMVGPMIETMKSKSKNGIVKAICSIEHVEQMRCLMSLNLLFSSWHQTILGIMLQKGNVECLKSYVERYCNVHSVMTGFALADFNHYKSSKIILPLTQWLKHDVIGKKKPDCTSHDISSLFNDVNIVKRIFKLLFNSLAVVKRFPNHIMSTLLEKYVSAGRYDLIRVIHNTVNNCFECLSLLAYVVDTKCIIYKLNNDGESELMKLILTANQKEITVSPYYRNIYADMINENIRKNKVMNLRVLLKFPPPNESFLDVVDDIVSIDNKAAKLFRNRIL